ncbi:MAG: GNAT family N-acetyltransferase [Clostridiales bacterium]|nr:GNAT family N-acetyltransferase [Clostridiales bacterium]
MDILNRIETMQKDHEPSQLSDDIEIFQNNHIYMIMNRSARSIYSTRVVYAHEDESYNADMIFKEAKDFFKYKKYSWYVTLPRDEVIYNMLLTKGWQVHDTYEGRYLPLKEKKSYDHMQIIEVEADSIEADLLGNVVAEVWGVKDQKRVIEAKNKYNEYLKAPDRRGGYVLAYHDGIAVGYATYRLSDCSEYLYLSGTGVIESYRKKGVYKNLLNYRLNKGFELKASYAIAQARKGHSSPILEKYGFSKMGEFKHLIMDFK